VIGLAWNRTTNEMYAAVNGYDVRGARPVKDLADATYKITQDTWYGWPDFSAGLEPLTMGKFEVEDNLQAPVFTGTGPEGKDLGFVIDHAASGLAAPDPALVAGMHPFHPSPSLLDVAPASWGEFAGQLFVAEWGDLTPATDPTELRPVGYRIVRVNPATRQVAAFVGNRQAGPASAQGAEGKGLERPTRRAAAAVHPGVGSPGSGGDFEQDWFTGWLREMRRVGQGLCRVQDAGQLVLPVRLPAGSAAPLPMPNGTAGSSTTVTCT
jgi:hypothetical protein